MLTEDEARKLWCPFARVSAGNEPVPGNHAANRWSAGELALGSMCIASDCMAWRWEREKERDEEGGWIMVATDKGHCGLAGKP